MSRFVVRSVADLMNEPIPPREKRSNWPIIYSANEIKCRGEPLSEVWWQGRQWAVTSEGIEARDGTYFIAAKRLMEDHPGYSWPEHICEKMWVDQDDFCTAWLVAIALHGARVKAPDYVRRSILKSHPQRQANGPG